MSSVGVANGNWALVPLCLGAGLAGLSVALTGPILVDIAVGYGISEALSGQLMTVAALSGMAGTLLLSPLLDRIARRPAITAALALMALAAFGCALAPTFLALSVAYCLVGLAAFTLVALVLAAIGDMHQGANLGRSMGWMTTGNVGITVLLLPVIAALADRFGWRVAFQCLAGLAALAALLVYRLLPAGLRSQRARIGYLAAFGGIMRHRTVTAVLLTVGLMHASMYGFRTYMGAMAIEQLAVTTAQVGPLFSLRSLGIALGAPLAGRYLRAGDWRCMAAAIAICAVLSITTYTAPGALALLAVAMFAYGLAVGVLEVGINSLLASAEAGGRGVVMAYRSVMDSLGGAVGPALGGAVIAGSGYPAAGLLFAAMAVGAGMVVATGARSAQSAAAAAPR